MSIVCFGHHHHFGMPDLSQPTLQPNPFAKHKRAGWKWSRLATGPLPLGCGAVPAACYTVTLERLLKKGFSEPTCTCFSLFGDTVHSAGLLKHSAIRKIKWFFFFFFLYLLQHYLFLLLASLFPHSVPPFYLFTVHTNTMAELVFLEARCLWRILIKHPQDAASTHTHTYSTNKFSYSWIDTHKLHTHTALETACKHASALAYCHCVRQRQGEVAGHGCAVHNIAESEN